MGKVIRRCGSFLMMLLLVIGILPMTVNAETTQNTEERNALYVQVPEDWENPCVWAVGQATAIMRLQHGPARRWKQMQLMTAGIISGFLHGRIM